MDKNMFRWITACGLLMLLAASGIAGAAGVQEMTLQKAVPAALEKSIEIAISDLSLKNAELEYQKNRANNLMTESRSLLLQAELTLAQAKDTAVQTKNSVVLTITENYLQLGLKQMEIGLNQKQLELEKRLCDEIKAQVSLGHLGQLDLMKQDTRYQNAAFSLQKAQDDYLQLSRKLKADLGIASAAEARFVPFRLTRLWDITGEEAAQAALKNSFTLEMRNRQIELAQLNLEKVKAVATPELDLQIAANDLQLARLNYEKARGDLTESVQNQYYLFQQSRNKLELNRQSFEQAEANYQIVKKQRTSGLKTENDLLTAQLSMLQEEFNRESATLSYIMNLLQLQNLMGIQIEVKFSEIIQ